MSVAGSQNWVIRMTTPEPPAPGDYFKVIDETWPAAEYRKTDRFTCRRGCGAGMRVSAITLSDDWDESGFHTASEVARFWGQKPIFSIRPGQLRLDAFLAKQGYAKCFETLVLAAPTSQVSGHAIADEVDACSEVLLQIQRDIWQAGGHITEPRLDVMERVRTPKTYLLGRLNNRPSGCGFVAISDGIAMLHALEILPSARRRGLGIRLTAKAALWAARRDASHFSLLVTAENTAARAMYEALGMELVCKYHYRVAQ